MRLSFILFICTWIFLGCDRDEIRIKLNESRSQPASADPSWGKWNFSQSTNYTFDSNYIEVSSGQASLKTLNGLATSGNGFNSGVHRGTRLSPSSKLTIDTRTSNSVADVNTIFPAKTANLVAHWKMDGDWNDASTNGNNGVATGSLSFTSEGKIGESAGVFNNTGGVDFGDSDGFTLNSGFTISTWIKRDNNNRGEPIIHKYNGSEHEYILGFFNDGNLYCWVFDDNNAAYRGRTATDFDASKWHHVSCTYDGGSASSGVKIFIDGQRVDSGDFEAGAFVSMRNTTQKLEIGTPSGGLHATNSFDGLLDDVAIWNVEFSETEIEALYNAQDKNYNTELSSNWTPQYSSLVGYWKMDGDWKDSSGSGNDASVVGVPVFNSESQVGISSALVDGNDYLEILDSVSLDITEVTTSCWVKLTSYPSPGRYYYLANKVDDYLGPFRFEIGSGGLAYFAVGDGSTILNATSPAGVVSLNRWHHVAASYNGNNMNVLVDGRVVASSSGIINMEQNNVKVYIGSAIPGNTENFKGSFDDCALWNKGLSHSEVNFIYNRQKQKYAAHYESPILDMGGTSTPAKMEWFTDLPFMKELALTSESSANYSLLVDSTGSVPSVNGGDLMSGIVGLWHLNESNGTSGAGSIKNAISTGPNGTPTATGVALGEEGRFNTSAQFDASGGSINLGTSSNMTISTGELSFSVWVYHNRIRTNGFGFIGNYAGGGFVPGTFDIKDYSHTITFEMGHDTAGQGYQCSITDGGKFSTGKWEHFVVTYSESDGVIKLFLNGEERAGSAGCTLTLGHTNLLNSGQDFLLGDMPAVSADNDLDGRLDEIGLWNRALNANEIKQLYRRGANRLKIQTRTCADATCSANEEWKGPDNTNGKFYFSELNNCTVRNANGTCDLVAGLIKTISPNFALVNFTNYVLAPNQYFQYRVLMESDDESDEATLPSMTSIDFGAKYWGGSPSIITNNGFVFTQWSGFNTSVTGVCSPSFQISLDKTNWYFYNGTNWALSGSSSDSNSEADINANASSFVSDVGAGVLYVQSFLNSDTEQSCILEDISIEGI